jgi:hypothetical protein
MNQSPTYRLAKQIWDAEEFLGVQHFMQSEEQFIKQCLQHDEIELAVRLQDLDKILIRKNMETWSDIITEHFTKCRADFLLEEPLASNEMFNDFEFWLSKYSKLLPTALRDEIISEEQVCELLEASGDYFAGFENSEYLKDKWLPYNSILERVEI